MTHEQAADFRRLFFEAYPAIRDWHTALARRRSPEGRTLTGRRYSFPKWYGLPAHSNAPVQGLSLIHIYRNQTLADVITRSVRYPGSSRVLTVLEEISAEAVEIMISPDSPAAGKSLIDLKMPPGSLIGLLERGNEMLIPTGGTILKAGDKVVLFGTAAVMDTAMLPFGEDKS